MPVRIYSICTFIFNLLLLIIPILIFSLTLVFIILIYVLVCLLNVCVCVLVSLCMSVYGGQKATYWCQLDCSNSVNPGYPTLGPEQVPLPTRCLTGLDIHFFILVSV